jgi:uroporphyrinogen-III synthase
MPSWMANPVVITRPLAQADSLASRIRAIGREAIVFPLLDILPLPNPVALKAELENLAAYSMVAFVSPNAIEAAFSLRPDWPDSMAFAVMGEGSKATLARYGITERNATIISPRDPARTDSETLLDALDLVALKGKCVLIIRGATGRELLADKLQQAGVEVIQVAAYQRVQPVLDQYRQQQLMELLNTENDWVITSSEALRNLLQMAEQIDNQLNVVKMLQKNLIVPHIRIQETAQTLGFRNITLTGSGDERLLAALQSQS